MTNEEIFDVWAPGDAVWSQWAKPVLFAQRSEVMPPAAADTSGGEERWLPPASAQRAVVVDLPALQTMRIGLALAARGHRPVPLFNTCDDPAAVIDVRPLVAALEGAVDDLRRAALPAEAPPAFLLDSRRMRPAVPPGPGKFDNRWVVFPQDFPSATFLHARGIREVLLIQEFDKPGEDLAHVLRRWQEAGLGISTMPAHDSTPQPIVVEKPSWFRRLGYRFAAMAGLRRSNAGGFGAVIPVPGSGGGFG